jgi:hypothetical protein
MLFNRYNSGTRHTKLLQGTATFTNLASFMTGVYTSYTSLANYLNPTLPPNLARDWLYNTYGWYAQDDFRATSRLTLNLGLRYDFQTTPNDLNGVQSRFINIDDLTQSPTTGGWTYGPPMKNPGLKNFSPRLGFAWDVFGTGKTSVRSGFGIYYDIGNVGAALQQQVNGMPPYSVQEQVNSNPSKSLIAFPFCYTTSCTTQASVGGLQTTAYDVNTPYSYQYNFTIEQQLPKGIGLAVSYVGFQGRNLWFTKEANAFQYTSLVNGIYTWDPITCNGVLSAQTKCPTGQTQASNTPTVAAGTPCTAIPAAGTTYYERLNPCWSSTILTGTGSKSWYNSLQVVVNKRLSRGLEFQGTYTYSKSIDTTEGQMYGSDCGASGALTGIYPFNPSYDTGLSCFDSAQNMHFNLLYHIPNLKSDNAFVKEALNGWWVGNIVNIQTGFPFTPLLKLNRSNSGVFGSTADRPDVVATAVTGAGGSFIPYDPSTVTAAPYGTPTQWFNPYMFQLGRPGQLGNASRDMLIGPGQGTWNLSINKDTKLGFMGENGSVEFRAEIFNVLNRANFSIPSGTIFAGTASDAAGPTEAPSETAISSTQTSSRQIQLALKLIF